MEFLAVAEPEHQGYLAVTGRRALAVDPPTNVDAVAEFLPSWVHLAGVVETSVPADRVAGGRLLAAELDVPLYGPGGLIRGARPLRDGSRIAGFPEALAVAAPGRRDADVALLVADALLVGDLDTARRVASEEAAARVTAIRGVLADRHPAASARGSAGTRPVAELAALPTPPVGRVPLNAVAIELTNRGEADMFWADPRFGREPAAVDAEWVTRRLGSPWAPTVVDLRDAGADIDGAHRVAPARLASALDELAGAGEIVVVDDDLGEARRAAGFLARLGLAASFAAWPAAS